LTAGPEGADDGVRVFVKFCERVVKDVNRGGSASDFNVTGLRLFERDKCHSLLSARAEEAEVLMGAHELPSVAVGTFQEN
jgi:hypothetical protein